MELEDLGEPYQRYPNRAFESWFINECFRINSYFELDLNFSYLRTRDGVEIDLIVEKPSGEIYLIEVKSSTTLDERHFKALIHFEKDFPKARFICASQILFPQKIGKIEALPWKMVLEELQK